MSPRRSGPPGPSGVVVVDKPAGWTSHDVVARLRRLAGTRRVGHAGTLDPMATGVLVCGVERGTKLLTHLVGVDKTYLATVRLGAATVTDDAEGETTDQAAPGAVAALHPDAVLAAVARLTGELQQVPSAVSAIKVDGRRSYARVRSGEQVELAARPVVVRSFEVLAQRADEHQGSPVLDLDVRVDVSSGTYVRALARDLGADLGLGGHLTALRRTAVGGFALSDARSLHDLEPAPGEELALLPLAQAAARAMPVRQLDARESTALGYGQALNPTGSPGPVAAVAPDGGLVAVLADEGGAARPVAVLRPA